jgi:exodeoxyribonuclease V gamma subunit
MARWLNLRIAQQQGIAANNQYPQAGEWVWSLASRILDDIPRQDPYSRGALEWQVFDLLPGLLDHESFVSLHYYLTDDDDGLKRWQLAQRIADAFDRYQLFRPDRIRAWSDGEEHHWQARLWRKIVSTRQLGHRIEIIDQLIAHLADDSLPADLPERINLFALSRLAPVYIEFVHLLAGRTEVLLYQHNPTDQYWADLVSQKVQARKRLQNPDQAEYFDTGNSLLASWGKQGQAMQDLLLDLGSVTANEIDAGNPPANGSILHCLQDSLFRLESPPPNTNIDRKSVV